MVAKSNHNATRIVLGVSAFVVAASSSILNARIDSWLATHQVALPAGIFLLLAAMFVPRLRRFLIVTLCFAVGLFTLRQGFSAYLSVSSGATKTVFLDEVCASFLFVVSFLMLFAGIGETFQAEQVWTRRCYLGGASIYFLLQAYVAYSLFGSARSIIFAVAGIAAFGGMIFARRLVEIPGVNPPEDNSLQLSKDAAHRATLIAKEWRDCAVAVVEECERPFTLHDSHA